MTSAAPFACAPLLKIIARGAKGARPLSADETRTLFDAILAERVAPAELGGVLIAYRIKGETPVELRAMLDAAHATFAPLAAPAGAPAPVLLPSYNGARKQPNLTPLLALLLAREGIPVLVHGQHHSGANRVGTQAIFAELGHAACESGAQAEAALRTRRVAYLPIAALSPALERLLEMRAALGVRNSGHTVVKLLQPFAGPALRLVNYTHPEYRETLSELFRDAANSPAPGVLLSRGTEGEPVADARRQAAIEGFCAGVHRRWLEAEDGATGTPPLLPAADAAATARWIEAVLAGDVELPAPIARQVGVIRRALGLG
ncbi:DNA-binding protein YbiB [Pandoraea nosoerga]|uniref:DNA-binding protein YbiB n=1 Tax=Pandoraea nosoerga TaxID=2508296 RepID=A0A5E4RT12_9BURK|nr:MULTISPECIES: DNA-binding protein YbiB [Pandoraea]MBN4664572.1 DNA-binding protein YbiB [Pandoraea nosoerga]MBN4674392.1 DNA-binding protein YbiB [Pandoraea nosoerga]MBN4679660.1 DNA-binding protein YbiB [Pandoraea nosoerga]MBN4743251.1 DNA-binding protein YbiB [Pandoraea nosoerga]VVD65209.1 DNA-binding protein YbiB [Pandoraea nosoerga]